VLVHGGEFISQSSITFAIRAHLHPQHHPPPAPSPPSSRKKRCPKILHWAKQSKSPAREMGERERSEGGAGGGGTGGSCGHPVLCEAARRRAIEPVPSSPCARTGGGPLQHAGLQGDRSGPRRAAGRTLGIAVHRISASKTHAFACLHRLPQAVCVSSGAAPSSEHILHDHVRTGTCALRLHHSYHTPSVKPGFCRSSGVRLLERAPKTGLP
jgi:hypothetical protein